MSFCYRDKKLQCEGVPLENIADQAGTPCYVYSANAIRERFSAYENALKGIPHQVCYAVKANSNVGVLRVLAALGSGFDIVSGGELFRVLQAGGRPGSIVFSGVGKAADEIEYALSAGIHSFNCESEAEIDLISRLCSRTGRVANLSLRVNPDVDASTHPYISTGLREHKFGVDMSEVEQIYTAAERRPGVRMEGVSCHIGSQLLDPAPILEAVEKMLGLVDRLRANGHPIRHLDLGGGLGVSYRPTEKAPGIADLMTKIAAKINDRDLYLMVEPGRSIVAEAGILLSRVLYRKLTPRKEFIVVDAAMNDLIRPALYQSHHEILPVNQAANGTVTADVVGPVCETGDFLARDREMPVVAPGDLLSIQTAGAYGFVASSNYNSRPRAAEVLVDGSEWTIVRQRESFQDLVRGEV